MSVRQAGWSIHLLQFSTLGMSLGSVHVCCCTWYASGVRQCSRSVWGSSVLNRQWLGSFLVVIPLCVPNVPVQ